MAGTFTGKSLYDGQLSSSAATTIYTVPSSTVTYRVAVTLYNTSATTQTINLFLKRSGSTARQIVKISLVQYASYELTIWGPLSTGDLISGDSTTNTVVDATMCGVEET